MRRAVLGLLLLVVACSDGAMQRPPPVAPPGVWTDETGTVAFNYGIYGWDNLPSDPGRDGSLLLSLGNPGLKNVPGDLRSCELRRTSLPVLRPTQEELNSYILSRTAENVSAPNAIVSEMSFDDVSGVAIASYRVDTGSVAQFARVFHIELNGRPVQMFLTCGGSLPLGTRDIGNLKAVLASLQIGPEAVARAAAAAPLAPQRASTLPPQELRPWHDELSALSIGIPETWTISRTDAPRQAGGSALLTMKAPGSAGEPECEVSVAWPRTRAVDQASLNAEYGNRRNAATENNLVEGVRVLTVTHSISDPFYRLLIFSLPVGEGAREFHVQCRVTREQSANYDQDAADAEAMLNSVTFSRDTP